MTPVISKVHNEDFGGNSIRSYDAASQMKAPENVVSYAHRTIKAENPALAAAPLNKELIKAVRARLAEFLAVKGGYSKKIVKKKDDEKKVLGFGSSQVKEVEKKVKKGDQIIIMN